MGGFLGKLLHELSHYLACKIFNIDVHKVVVDHTGGYITHSSGLADTNIKRRIISLAPVIPFCFVFYFWVKSLLGFILNTNEVFFVTYVYIFLYSYSGVVTFILFPSRSDLKKAFC